MPENKQYTLNDSPKITERFFKLLDENTLDYSDELKIFSKLAERYKFMTVTEYAKQNNMSYNTAMKLVNDSKVINIKIAGVILISNL